MKNLQDLSSTLLAEIHKAKVIGILGFGREGLSSFRFIKTYFPEKSICIADKNTLVSENKVLQGQDNIIYCLGSEWLDVFKYSNVVLVSPGVPLFGIQIPDNIIISSQTDIILSCFGHKIIGITGTKGKSTSASLLQHVLKTSYDNIPLAGNIGIPPLDVFEQVAAARFAVFEISSHQLQYIKTSPHIALLLNVYEEHLDYYPDFETYSQTKFKIYQFQQENDIAIINKDNAQMMFSDMNYNGQQFSYSIDSSKNSSAYIHDNHLYLVTEKNNPQKLMTTQDMSLRGNHNYSNCIAIALIADILGLDFQAIAYGLRTFKSLPHRLERIVSNDGKIFYNDSISTIPESTLFAIEALESVQTVIIGGMNRHISYSDFCEKLSMLQIENIILYGEVGSVIYDVLSKLKNINAQYIYKKDFSECVQLAIELTNIGEICLLSPAASSYDQFQNFEKRGDFFREMVTNRM
jgi:UDP-N-acetylmuramoylalanine--D-glutamate ligase